MPSTAEATRASLEPALDALEDDRLVAFPTETVWGLAARAESGEALDRLRAFKGRDADKPVSVLVDSPDRLDALGVSLGPQARHLVSTFWPGPLTLVCRCDHAFAPGVAAANGSVGFRCSPHPVAAALVAGAFRRGLGPVTATSLNRSGEPPARRTVEALRVTAGAEDVVLAECQAGEDAGGELPSTVVDATGDTLQVLREGAISESALHASLDSAETASR